MSLTEEQKKNNLRRLSLEEIKVRLGVVTKIIKQAQKQKDPRWETLVPQQRRLNEILVEKLKERRRLRGEREPEPTITEVKPVKLTARRVRS